MRVAIFVDSFPLVSETFILRQITGLIDLGHEVSIFADSRPPEEMPMQAEFLRYGLKDRTTYVDMPPESGYWEMPVWPPSGQTWSPGAAEPLPNEERILRAVPNIIQCLSNAPRLTLKVLDPMVYGGQALSLSALYRLSALCSQAHSYDVLHAHFGPVGNRFRFAKELWNVPFIVTFHGYDFCSVPRKEGKDVYARLFEAVDAATVNCEYARQRVKELGCPSDKIHTLHVGLELQDFPFRERISPQGGQVRILTLGRLVEKKGIECSMRAVSRLRSRHPRIRYDIIGDGPLRPKLEELIVRLGAGDYIFLHGAQNGDYVRRVMSESHLFILSSVTASDGDQEGTPVSLMEAQASGLPVLSTWHSGIPEVVLDGESGFLVPERDVEALSERLDYLLLNPESWQGLGLRGRRHVEDQYNIKRLNSHLVELYKEVRRKRSPQ